MIEQSESIAALSKALVAFHKEVKKVGKDSTNPFFKSSYASLENILDAVGEPLSKNGLAVIQLPAGTGGIATQLVHESGEWVRSVMEYEAKERNNPQAQGSAITYARRYAISAVLCLNVGEDDDGNAASTPHNAPQRPTAASNASEAATTQPFDRKKLADGDYEVDITETKEGEKGGRKWQLLKTTMGDGFNSTPAWIARNEPLNTGTYFVRVIKGNVMKADPALANDGEQYPFSDVPEEYA